MSENYIVPCPQCRTTEGIQWLRLKDGRVAIMCWNECGQDYEVNGIWFMLNRRESEEE